MALLPFPQKGFSHGYVRWYGFVLILRIKPAQSRSRQRFLPKAASSHTCIIPVSNLTAYYPQLRLYRKRKSRPRFFGLLFKLIFRCGLPRAQGTSDAPAMLPIWFPVQSRFPASTRLGYRDTRKPCLPVESSFRSSILAAPLSSSGRRRLTIDFDSLYPAFSPAFYLTSNRSASITFTQA